VVLRCVLVDDNPEFLVAAREMLQRAGLDVVGTASTGDQALERVAELRPDVVLLDLYLGPESGFDVAHRLAELDGGESNVVLISTYDQQDWAELVAASPAVGFLSKADLSAEAIRSILGMPLGK
jgi:DNA-binding NarL/FixJ family response regulator